MSTWKKPWPLMARSLELLVCSRLPWVCRRSVATSRTPVPTCKPEGRRVSVLLWAPGWRTFWYTRSSNTARERLKPLVLTFARLLAITSICPCWASSPVFAVHSDRIIVRFLVYSTGRSALQGKQAVGAFGVFVGGADGFHLHVVAPRVVDHRDHGVGRADVAAFQRTGRHAQAVVGRQRL